MLINRPAIDYIRITTSDWGEYERLATGVHGLVDGDVVAGRFLQYQGSKRGASFHGQAIQNDRAHYLGQVSGAPADGCDGLLHLGRVTRIDLQVTINKPDGFTGRRLCDCLRAAVWDGRRRKVTLIDGAGDDTVYIGSRLSDVYIRVYVKAQDYLRFEVEYKGDGARRVALGLQGGITRAELLAHELARLPECVLLREFRDILTGGVVRLPELVAPEKIGRLKWLSSLLPTFHQMANDHDYGHTVRAWFHSLAIAEHEDIG